MPRQGTLTVDPEITADIVDAAVTKAGCVPRPKRPGKLRRGATGTGYERLV
jgi:hypothetical protein